MSEYRYIDGDTNYYKFGGEVYPIGFKIYYSDYSVYTGKGNKEDLKHAWNLAPDQDVQIVILYQNTKDGMGRNTRMVYSGVDYYIFDGDMFVFSNEEHSGTILYGVWMEDRDFRELFNNAWSDYNI